MAKASVSARPSATGTYVPQYPKTEAAAAVMQVLTARDHYAALNASETDSISTLRRRYLQASFSVHPDKNSHSGATEAFKRVSVAWKVLGDENERQKYDTEFKRFRAKGGLWPGAFDSNDFVSQEDAFSVFARAQQEGTETRGDDYPASASSEFPTGRAAFDGVATAAGLWATGRAFNFLGMSGIGSIAQRFAMASATANVIMAARNPTVQQTVASAADAVSHSADYVSASARDAFSDAIESATSIANTARQAAGLMDCCVQVRQRVREDGIGSVSAARDAVEREAEAMPAVAMDSEDRQEKTESSVQESEWRRDVQRTQLVRIVDLKTAQHLNGRLGRLVGVTDSGRVKVCLLPITQIRPRTTISNDRVHSVEDAASTDVRTSVVKLVRPENLEDPAIVTCSTKPPSSSSNFV
eukprot:TRINITY_DN2508_c0_g2_i1.p1 TRINITY_DN2508_c0_g2~~TRINITY_DN2508_c0_g2_i1.p1  ORF type:complete len:429 (+),score=55.72 TRINITY_DN2508_c0_g2_i1:48-1289(+)